MKLLSILLLLFTLLAADYDEREHEYRERHMPLDLSNLELSDKQRHSVKKIIRQYRSSLREFHRQQRRTRTAVAELFAAETFDKEEFIHLNGALQNRAVTIQAMFFSRMHSVLTPRQKKRFIYYMEEWEVE